MKKSNQASIDASSLATTTEHFNHSEGKKVGEWILCENVPEQRVIDALTRVNLATVDGVLWRKNARGGISSLPAY